MRKTQSMVVALAPLFFTHFTQGLQITLPFALGVYMVRDFLSTDGAVPPEQKVGQLTGVLGSAFSAAQLITSYPMGIMSDKIGRKPILLLGNVSCAVGVLLFGMAHTYWFAAMSRVLAGLFNCIIGAEKAMIGESLSLEDQASAMGFLSLSWGIGVLIGPLIGGGLARPCDGLMATTHWACNERGGFFVKRPYLLPCIVAASFNVIAGLWVAAKLQETLPRLKRYTRIDSDDFGHVELTALQGKAQTHGEGGETLRDASSSNTRPWYHQTTIILCLSGYGLVALTYSLLDETIPLFASAPAKEGGLGFAPSQLALPLSFGGLILVLWALIGFPWMMRQMGPVRSCKHGLWQTVPMCLLIPCASLAFLPSQVVMFVAMGVKAVSATNAFTSCIILVNAVSPPQSLGAVNGVGQTIASFVRAAGPLLGGVSWSAAVGLREAWQVPWGHQFVPFVLAIFVVLMALIVYSKVGLPGPKDAVEIEQRNRNEEDGMQIYTE